eukprot:COSAG06_NODE_31_length_31488_cov_60.882793_24_plen_85_part_00
MAHHVSPTHVSAGRAIVSTGSRATPQLPPPDPFEMMMLMQSLKDAPPSGWCVRDLLLLFASGLFALWFYSWNVLQDRGGGGCVA